MAIIYKNGIAYGNQRVLDATLTQQGEDADAKAVGDALALKAGTGVIADDFSTSQSYAIGDYTYYNGSLYRFTAAHSAGAWVGTDAQAVQLAEDVVDLKNTLNHKADVIYDTASGPIASFPDGADGLPVKDLTVAIEPVQDTSGGDPSPTHICPISGWTGCNVTRTGFNVWDEEWDVGSLDDNTGEKIPSAYYIRSKNFIPVIPGKSYWFKTVNTTNGYAWIYAYDADKNFIKTAFANNGHATIKNNGVTNNPLLIPDGVYYIKFLLDADYGNVYKNDFCINLSDPAKNGTYEPGHVVTIPISWQSSAGTVYGGTLDVTTGVLTVDRAMANMGNMTWTYYSGSGGYLRSDSITDIGGLSALCSIYPQSFASTLSSAPNHSFLLDIVNQRIYVKDSDYTNGDVFQTAMNGQKIVYLLDQPISVTLTPTEIETLLGQNNVWADCGSSTVEYPADTKLYIERLTAPEEDDMIANQNIASGVYFMVGNNLYLSTASISANEAIKPGTGAGYNCIAKSLADALNDINS